LRFLKPCHEYCSTGVVHTTDVVEACKDVNIAIMVGGIPRKEGMERITMLSKNGSIYKAQASALEQHAAADCKVRNPINVLECVDIRF
jgi:malate/lactate dehydrogenase